MRTTLDIDDPILREIKAIQEREGRSMGAIVSELLAQAFVSQPARASFFSMDQSTDERARGHFGQGRRLRAP